MNRYQVKSIHKSSRLFSIIRNKDKWFIDSLSGCINLGLKKKTNFAYTVHHIYDECMVKGYDCHTSQKILFR